MLGIQIFESTVAKYVVRHRNPPSRTWRTLLGNYLLDLVTVDFFTVPTATFQILYVFVILHHDRREIVHFNATYHPTAEFTALRMIDTPTNKSGARRGLSVGGIKEDALRGWSFL